MKICGVINVTKNRTKKNRQELRKTIGQKQEIAKIPHKEKTERKKKSNRILKGKMKVCDLILRAKKNKRQRWELKGKKLR